MKPGGVGSLLRDKRVQIGAAVAGGLGLVVLLRRGGAPVDGGAAGGGQQLVPAAGFDSSGTDMYNAIQSLGQGWEQDLRDWTDTLTDISDKLDKQPSTGTGSDPSKGTPKPPTPAPKPGTYPPRRTPTNTPRPAPRPAGSWVSVGKWKSGGAPWNSTLWGIAHHYGTSVSRLKSLNHLSGDTIHPGQRLRYK